MIKSRYTYIFLLTLTCFYGCATDGADEETSVSADVVADAVTGLDVSVAEDSADALLDQDAGDAIAEADAGDGGGTDSDTQESSSSDGESGEDLPIFEEISLGARGAISGMFAVSKTRVYMVGEEGTILLWNGSGWSPQDPGTQEDLHGIWAQGSDFAVAVGAAGTVSVYDGERWTLQDTGIDADLYAVYGFASDDVYAVGAGGFIGHWDGESWTEQLSNLGGALLAVWGPNPQNVFAAGAQAQVLRRTGGAWVASAAAASSVTLQGIWGTSTSNVYAVGSKGTISRWNGASWNTMVSNDFQERDLYSIWGTAEDNVFAVGDSGTVVKFDQDADDWELDPVDGPFNKTADLRAIAGYLDPTAGATNNKQTRAFASGLDAKTLFLDDGDWSDSMAGMELDLHDVWVSESVATAVGDGGTIVRKKTSGWAGEVTGTTKDLYSVSGHGEDLYAVGEGGVVLSRVNGLWESISGTGAEDLHGVWATADGFVAVGAKGLILRMQDGVLLEESSGVVQSLRDIWGNSTGGLYAVGDLGTVLYSSTLGEWEKLSSGTSSNLEAVHGSDGDVWAVGNWTIIHGDATGFSVAETFSSDYLYGIWVSPDGEVFAAGWAGLFMSLIEDEFTASVTGTTAVLESIMGVSSDDYYVVGRQGMLLRYRQVAEAE